MSDISKFRYTKKRRIDEIDDTLENLSHAAKNLGDKVFRSEFECSLLAAKLKREKVRALSAVAKSQVILAEMEIVIAESELVSDLERLKTYKKAKFGCNEDQFRQTTPIASIPTSPQNAVSTTRSKTNSTQVQSTQTKKKKSSSKKHNTALDETVLCPTIEQGKSGTVGDLLNQPLAKVTSDSEISMTSSINAEFNDSYPKLTVDNKHTTHSKKHKSDSKISSKSKSSKVRKNESLSITEKTEAEANKNLFHKMFVKSIDSSNSQLVFTTTQENRLAPNPTKPAVSTSYIPVKHNLPLMISQSNFQNTYDSRSSPSVMSPCLYVNAAMTRDMYQTPSRKTSQNYSYIDNKQ